MPEPTKRQQILEAILSRLRAIKTIDGFATDAGQAVYLGYTPDLGKDDPAVALAIVPATDSVRQQQVNVLRVLPIEIQAIATAELDQPWVVVEAVLGDIQRAIELEDRTLGGLLKQRLEPSPIRTLPRDPGFTTVGGGITYLAPYLEGWGGSS